MNTNDDFKCKIEDWRDCKERYNGCLGNKNKCILDLPASKVRPSYILKPRLSIDGNQWCALFGDNLQDGVAGFGDSPELAYQDFDRNWEKSLAEVNYGHK